MRFDPTIVTVGGVSRTIKEWSEITGISPSTIAYRINTLKWDVERAVTEPATPIPRKNHPWRQYR